MDLDCIMNKLDEICARKRTEVLARQAVATLDDLDRQAREQTAPRGFANALTEKAHDGLALIAEIKKASPSKGLIRGDFRPAEHAVAYERGGAACLSVLTDERYFQGHELYLEDARRACGLPVLRKDFMIDPWQVAEARAIGADAILIIVAALDDVVMSEIEAAAFERGMDVLVEVHDELEMGRAARLRSRLIGINNRDLKTFQTDIGASERLAQLAPLGSLLVAESGIADHSDCQRLAASGIRAFLVGESLMRQNDIEDATRRLLHGS